MKRKPHMAVVHHHRRLSWATRHVTWSEQEWGKVVWSDEKKFNLDGPDWREYYWHDYRISPKVFSKRHSGGDSFMIWECFSSQGCGQIAILDGRLNAHKYCEILENYLLPYAYMNQGTQRTDFRFMHDGATAHTANTVA